MFLGMTIFFDAFAGIDFVSLVCFIVLIIMLVTGQSFFRVRHHASALLLVVSPKMSTFAEGVS